jgi:hypothetical protein
VDIAGYSSSSRALEDGGTAGRRPGGPARRDLVSSPALAESHLGAAVPRTRVIREEGMCVHVVPAVEV